MFEFDRDYLSPDQILEFGGNAARAWFELYPPSYTSAEQIAGKYAIKFEGDFSHPGDLWNEFLSGHFKAVSFNCCALPNPLASAKAAATTIYIQESAGLLSEARRTKIFNDTRKLAADLVNLPDPSGVVFCRNTTEAMSFYKWLADMPWQTPDLGLTHRLVGSVMTSDIENQSVQREIELIRDPGNPDRNDPISTFTNWGSLRLPNYPDVQLRTTGLSRHKIYVYGQEISNIKSQIARLISRESIDVVILSHVDRHSGRELPVTELTHYIRALHAQYWPNKRTPFVMIDGAQALGNVPKVDFCAIGCDAYIASPHKTLRSEVVGLLFFDPSNPRIQAGLARLHFCRPESQVILGGMFATELGVEPNVTDQISCADVSGLAAAIKFHNANGVIKNDCSSIDQKRRTLQNYFLKRHGEVTTNLKLGLVIPEAHSPSSFFIGFELYGTSRRQYGQSLYAEPGRRGSFLIEYPSLDLPHGYKIAHLMAQLGFFTSYLANANVIRVSFDSLSQSLADIDRMIEAFHNILARPEYDILRERFRKSGQDTKSH